MLTTKRLVAMAAVALVAVLLQAGAAQATTTSDRAAAIVIYPKIVVDSSLGADTIVQLTNASSTTAVQAHCFYVNATSHCSDTGNPCRSGLECPLGACLPGWSELDFSVVLTPDQPFSWVAGVGRNSMCAQQGTCDPLPLRGMGVCSNGGGFPCTSNADCGIFGLGECLGAGRSNAGTAIPPTPDDPFVGELKCVQINADGTPSDRNDLIGKATIVTAAFLDAQSYNAVGLVAGDVGDDRVLTIGGESDGREYSSCPSTLILDHIFDGAPDPIDGAPVVTDLTLVPCTENFALGAAATGKSTAQFLVINEFEQRFSASLPVDCFAETLISNIDTRNNARSIFSIGVAGTIAGQARIRPVGSGLVGVARMMKLVLPWPPPPFSAQLLGPVVGWGAGYNLHQQGERNGGDSGGPDTIVLP